MAYNNKDFSLLAKWVDQSIELTASCSFSKVFPKHAGPVTSQQLHSTFEEIRHNIDKLRTLAARVNSTELENYTQNLIKRHFHSLLISQINALEKKQALSHDLISQGLKKSKLPI